MVSTTRVPAENPPGGMSLGRILTQDPTLSLVCSPPQSFNPPAWTVPKTGFNLLGSFASEQLWMRQHIVNAPDMWEFLHAHIIHSEGHTQLSGELHSGADPTLTPTRPAVPWPLASRRCQSPR